MPLNGRRVGEILVLAGGRADQQQWMLDGVNASNIALEAPQALLNPPVESVHQSNTYSAEFGNSSADVILTTPKSGTTSSKAPLTNISAPKSATPATSF